MLGFYGGPNGKSFEISWIFTTKTGDGNSLDKDVSMGWKSSISVGSYVVVSYGDPSSENFDTYHQEDLKNDGKSYNATLWQKIYDENQNKNNGIAYRLITSISGYTPRIQFVTPVEKLDADADPQIEYDFSDIERPKIKLKLPQSQILSLVQPTKILNANQMPFVVYDEKDINRPTLAFSLPQSQRIKLGTVTVAKANEKPKVELNIDNINEPALNFTLPVAQLLQQGKTVVLDANGEPSFSIDSEDVDNPTLTFSLPRSQVMQAPGLNVLDPSGKPAVKLEGTVNEPKLTFSLPRAVKFYYGNLLGHKDEGTYTESNEAFSEYGVGDYYINAPTGFIYEVTAVDGTSATFRYVACIQSPLPEIGVKDLDPYTPEGEATSPTVTRSLTNTEGTAWKLEFGLPQMPIPEATATFVGAMEEGDVSAEPSESKKIKFTFTIPKGSRLFVGTLVSGEGGPTSVPDAKPGDVYLNAQTGKSYILQVNDEWTVQEGSLKGPVGDALHVYASYTTEETNTFENGQNLITSQYQGPYTSDQIFAVTFEQKELGAETSYWYFYTDEGKWGRVQLTSGNVNFIENTYQESLPEEPINNKTYSVDYINKLIGGEEGQEDKTAYSKQQVIKMLSWGTFQEAKNG